MPEKRSVYTQVGLELGEELARMRKEADKSKAVPFGMERVEAETEARRLLGMGKKERAAYLKQHGLAKTLDVARRGLRNAK